MNGAKTPKLVAVPSSPWFGTTIQVSKDLGKKFKPTKSAPAFAADDVDRIMGFFADPCSYRVTEARDPIKGFAAVKAQIGAVGKACGGCHESFRQKQ